MSLFAGETQPAAEPPPRHSFLDPVSDFIRDDILHPVHPFEWIPGKSANDWSFSLEPYVWAMGVSGTSGVNGMAAIDIGVNAKKLLQQLNWAVMAQGEVRKGRWGLLADGLYAELSGSGEIIGSKLYDSGGLEVQQGMASLALAYRVIDDRRGFLDFYVGARYNYIGTTANATVDQAGVDALSTEITNRVAEQIRTQAQDNVNSVRATIQDELARRRDLVGDRIDGLRQDLISGLASRLAGGIEGDLRGDISDSTKPENILRAKKIRAVVNQVRGPMRELVAASLERADARIEAAVASLKAEARSRVEARVARAEARVNAAKTKLSKAIAQEIEDELPTSAEGSQWWVEPIIGLRGQVNFTRWLYLTAQGDVGGFGAGSQIAWNALAALGVNFTRNVYAELGYRYMYVDYENGDFFYIMNSFGIYSSIGVKF